MRAEKFVIYKTKSPARMDFSPLHDILRNFFYFIKLFLLFVTVNRLLINRFYIKIIEHTFWNVRKSEK